MNSAHLGLRREPHHPFDAGTVVPGTVEQHHLARGREVLDVALEVPLGALAVARGAERDDTNHPWVGACRDPLDHTPLASGVASFEHHHDAGSGLFDPLLQLHELDLQTEQLPLVDVGPEAALLVVGLGSEALVSHQVRSLWVVDVSGAVAMSAGLILRAA